MEKPPSRGAPPAAKPPSAAKPPGSEPTAAAAIPAFGAPPSKATPPGPRTYEVIQAPQPQAIVVHCSDPRFQQAFEQFIQNELGLAKGQYVPIVVGGGAGVLARPQDLPKEFKFLRDRLELHGGLFPSIRRLILINHQDCQYYASLTGRLLGFLGPRAKSLADQSRDDLPAVVRIVARLLSHLNLSVEVYYAHFTDDARAHVTFEKIT
jgi:hypothetical protein